VSAHDTTENCAAQAPALPLTLQIGFAGSRSLLAHLPAGLPAHDQLRAEFKAVLLNLHQTLQLSPQVFFTAVSQLAVGADTLFTELVAELGWPQRILLPQARDEFFAAAGSAGPDFQPEDLRRAQALLESPHIIEERVVSTANTRTERFQETNLRILEEADVLLCMQVQGAERRPGGTSDMLARALARKQCVLVLTLRADAGEGPLLEFSRLGGGLPDAAVTLPSCVQTAGESIKLQGTDLPKLDSYVAAVKMAGSKRAGRRRVGFQFAAGVVIGTHVMATLIALLALKLGHVSEWVVIGLLLFEVGLLLWGYFTHRWLHNEHALRDWAMARLCAEIARSVRSLRGMPMALDHLRQLGLPPELSSLIKTLNVLHLHDNREMPAANLPMLRQRYLSERMNDPRSGQEPYYKQEKASSLRYFNAASNAFVLLSVLALLATVSKLLILVIHPAGNWVVWKDIAGPAAILLPVVAVGFMSLATAMDWDARAHSFNDTHLFVQRQSEYIAATASLREFTSLALQTESRLLGETLSWFARRAYVGVA